MLRVYTFTTHFSDDFGHIPITCATSHLILNKFVDAKKTGHLDLDPIGCDNKKYDKSREMR